ncbi:YfjI family protein [Mycolicibacter arupensis]|uniref:YfjI family protein n=1 Tax=Mycolicibacter arupensis TaxID=342002 RepID=UPI00122C1ACB|nr:YfjI family protein [Mycolicibacter arupensis]KAA1431865.1 DUF3987 domain-containing protein [Mycolicibacter arupensis]
MKVTKTGGTEARAKRNGHRITDSDAQPADWWNMKRVTDEFEVRADCMVLSEFGETVWGQLRDAMRDRLGVKVDGNVTFADLPAVPGDWASQVTEMSMTRAQVAEYAAQHGLDNPHDIAARLAADANLEAEQERQKVLALFAGDPLPLTVQKLPPFPVHALPTVAAEMATAVSRQFDVDPAMPAVFALGAMSAAVQGRLVVQPYPGWTENGALYVLAVAGTGERKSPVMRLMFSDPINTAERQLRDDYRHADAVPFTLGDEDDAEPVVLTVGDIDGPVFTPADSDSEPDDDAAPPRLVASDITPEKLAVLMAEQGEVMCLSDAEGSALDMMLGMYAPTPNLRLYLQAYTRERVLVDRKNGTSVDLDEPSLTFCLATQHDTWDRVMGTPRLAHNGVIPRFATAYCETRESRYARWLATPVGEREQLGDPVPGKVAARYFGLLAQLTVHMRGQDSRVLPLADDAAARVRRYAGIHGELDDRMHRPDGDLGGEIAAWAAKSGGRMLRTAAMLHMWEHGTAGYRLRIEADTITAAIEIEEWFIANARAAHDVMTRVGSDKTGEATAADLRAISEWLVRKHRGDGVKQWEPHTPMPLSHITQFGPKKQRSASVVRSAVEQLAAVHHVATAQVGKGTAALYLHPAMYS